MAKACLYLACKAEESLRKVRDIINVVHYLLKPHDLPMLKIGKVDEALMHFVQTR